MNKYDLNNSICNLLITSRNAAGKSQKYMSLALGKSLNTIQNYEAGLSNISVNVLYDWFNVLGLNPLYYLMMCLCPERYNINSVNASDCRQALTEYINNIASDDEITKLAFCTFSPTGSSFSAQIDMLTAINHLQLNRRVNVAQMVLDNYLMDGANNNLILTKYVAPDIEKLSHAINNGRDSVYNGRPGYKE